LLFVFDGEDCLVGSCYSEYRCDSQPLNHLYPLTNWFAYKNQLKQQRGSSGAASPLTTGQRPRCSPTINQPQEPTNQQ